MRSALARKTAGAGDARRKSRSAARTPFISVAFVAAVFFVPLVIMTGLMTEPVPRGTSSGPGLATLRGTIDAQAMVLRPSED
ncbi:MAG TPA: hypothetical protein VH414_17285 [Lichenihabitans sp.]|nr:hypothetical protein [Lichenihabitans sp.]